mmetsp:Transcript_8825/g.29198  ORF Transcript_8825/g.29198 Transcript_8825/m.29198 type:complete len:202 (+) Transcript_8825:549-1154(+)
MVPPREDEGGHLAEAFGADEPVDMVLAGVEGPAHGAQPILLTAPVPFPGRVLPLLRPHDHEVVLRSLPREQPARQHLWARGRGVANVPSPGEDAALGMVGGGGGHEDLQKHFALHRVLVEGLRHSVLGVLVEREPLRNAEVPRLCPRLVRLGKLLQVRLEGDAAHPDAAGAVERAAVPELCQGVLALHQQVRLLQGPVQVE